MNYREAIIKINKEHGLGVFKDRFLTRSILSDYVGSEIYAKKLIEVLYEVSSDFNIALLFKKSGLEKSRNELQGVYPKYSKRFSKREFVDAINPISEVVLPNEYISKKPNDQKNKDNQVVINKKNKKHDTIKIVKQEKKVVQPPLKKNVIIDADSIEEIDVCVRAKTLNINVWEYDKVDVLIGQQAKRQDLKGLSMSGNKLSVTYYAQDEEVTIYLPDKQYKKIAVDCLNTDIYQNQCDGKTLKVDKAVFTTISGSIFLNVKANNLQMRTQNGTILFGNHVYKAKASTVNGNIYYCLHEKRYKNIDLNLSTINGDIDGIFLDHGLDKKIGAFLSKVKCVDEVRMAGKTQVHLSLMTINGKIKVK